MKTLKQDRLNSYMLVHSHKTVADTLDPLAIAKTFASANEQRKGHLGNSSKRRLVCLTQETTYVAGWIGTFHFFIHTPRKSLVSSTWVSSSQYFGTRERSSRYAVNNTEPMMDPCGTLLVNF